MQVTDATDPFVTVIEDSRRWKHVELRSDDIVISTPPKSGTTWTQGIVSSLLWPDGDAPGRLHQRSPWPDVRGEPIADVAARIEAIEHRRFIKSHAAAAGLPWAAEVRYLAVYRNPADALVSWGNHRTDMSEVVMQALNPIAAAEDGLDPLMEVWDGQDWGALYDEWISCCNPFDHLAQWWPRRTAENVLLVHYADLFADLEAWMRRIADFLGIVVPSAVWPAVVDRCSLDSMRETARTESPTMDAVWRNGADSFYSRGGLGRGAGLLPGEFLDRLHAAGKNTLPADALAWLTEGGTRSSVV